jgi:hypothetical protein
MINPARRNLVRGHFGLMAGTKTIMVGKRRLAMAVLLGLAPALASCGGGSESGISAYVADHWPRWAGGMPDDVPPRPGAPGYNEFISHGGANQDAARAANAPAPEFVATGSATTNGKPTASVNGRPAAAAAKTKPKLQPATAAQIRPPEEPPAQEQVEEPERDAGQISSPDPRQDSSVVKGGLY